MADPSSEPYISPQKVLPEITVKSVILGFVLSMVLSGANAYLGLFAGMTVSASIPAAVISMAILRAFKNTNVLENNQVQTAASAGESLAAGVIFTLPALILMGYWDTFSYWETTLIAGSGGLLGVLFTIPLRSALIVKQKLRFPEGVATAEVLKSGEKGGKSVRYLIMSALAGGIFKFLDQGAHIWEGIMEKATLLKNNTYLYFGMNLSPALIAVGYIVGLNIATLVFIGGAISWWIAIPAYLGMYDAQVIMEQLWEQGYWAGKYSEMSQVSYVDLGHAVWDTKIRFLGVGAMVVGGIWALVSIRQSLTSALKQGWQAVKESKEKTKEVLRTELDTPLSWVLMGVGVLLIPIFILYIGEIKNVPISLLMTILMVIAGFLFSAVAGYMAGLVGSSNNPISGLTIATILSTSLLLVVLMGTDAGNVGGAAAILVGAVVCCAAAIAGDNMQDLKAGHILGATPWRQQIMQMIGVVGAAIVLSFILNLLNTAYGIGSKALPAPQATLMQSVAKGVFGGDLPWNFVSIGAAIAVVVIALDQYLAKKGASFRLPVLAVAVGLYLPFELDSSIMVGGVVAWLVQRYKRKRQMSSQDESGLLFASGLITGEALIGILMAIPIVIAESKDVLAFIAEPIGSWPGLLLLLGIVYWLYKVGTISEQSTTS